MTGHISSAECSFARVHFLCSPAALFLHDTCFRICTVVQGKVRADSNADVAFMSFMEDLKENEAEYDPESAKFFLNCAEYPSVTALWTAYCSEYIETHERYGHEMEEPPMSLKQFSSKFNAWYREDVKIPKTNRFAQCDRCFNLKQKISLACNAKTKEIWREALRKHTDDARQDRAVYYHNRSVFHTAECNPVHSAGLLRQSLISSYTGQSADLQVYGLYASQRRELCGFHHH